MDIGYMEGQMDRQIDGHTDGQTGIILLSKLNIVIGGIKCWFLPFLMEVWPVGGWTDRPTDLWTEIAK